MEWLTVLMVPFASVGFVFFWFFAFSILLDLGKSLKRRISHLFRRGTI